MSILASRHRPLRWYQYRLRFLLVLFACVGSAAPFIVPLGHALGGCCLPDDGGHAIPQPGSSSDPVLDAVLQQLLKPTGTAAPIIGNFHDRIAAQVASEQAKTGAVIEKLGGRAEVDKSSPFEWVISVTLEGTKTTDAELAYLEDLFRLQILNLLGTQITDAGLKHLEGLSELKELDVRDTAITEEAAKKLQQALPNCKIER
jgi:hypothetical protein